MPSKATITIQTIIQASFVILEEGGLSGLTMRRLATELGVEAASLYYHIKNKEALFGKIVDAMALEAIDGVRPGGSWQETIRIYAYAWRRTLQAHPAAVMLAATRSISEDVGYRLIGPIAEALGAAGLSEDETMRIVATCSVFVNGHALAEFGNAPEPPTASQEFYDEWFAFGLETLIAGLEKTYGR